MDKEKIIQTSMQMILHAGNARNNIHKAGEKITENNLEDIESLLKEAEEEVLLAHKVQTSMLQDEAKDQNIELTILFTHAQDTLMTTESELFFLKTLWKYALNRKD